jgi:outer membrane protein
MGDQFISEEKRMKKIGMWIFCGAVILAWAAGAWGADPLKIGYVDMQRTLNQCVTGQEAKKVITGEVEKMHKSLEGRQKELNKLREDLEKRGTVMNESVRREKEKEYQAKLRDVQRMQRDFEEDVRRKDRELTDKVLRDLAIIVQQIGEEGKYSIILEGNQPSIIYISKGLDLTEEVIKRANALKSK